VRGVSLNVCTISCHVAEFENLQFPPERPHYSHTIPEKKNRPVVFRSSELGGMGHARKFSSNPFVR
jgi:hypothetical protein